MSDLAVGDNVLFRSLQGDEAAIVADVHPADPYIWDDVDRYTLVVFDRVGAQRVEHFVPVSTTEYNTVRAISVEWSDAPVDEQPAPPVDEQPAQSEQVPPA